MSLGGGYTLRYRDFFPFQYARVYACVRMCMCMCMYMVATSMKKKKNEKKKTKKINTLPDDPFRLAELCNPITGSSLYAFLIIFHPSFIPSFVLILISILYVVSW